MAHFLVTGGCGFIGSHLAYRLVEDGHDVRILDNLSSGTMRNAPAEAEVVVGDIRSGDTVAAAMDGIDGCFHLAAVASVAACHSDPVGTHAVNQTGTILVFDAARRAGRNVPVVYASSAAVYGNNDRIPLAEDAPAAPLSSYGADKLGCEYHAAIFAMLHDVPATGFRFFNVYGSRQNPHSPYSGVISIFCDRVRAGAPLTIHGDGDQVRDFVYVGDVARVLVRAMIKPPTRPVVLNVCTGTGTSVLELARTIGVICGRRPELRHVDPRPGDVRRSIGDPGRLRRHFGDFPFASLSDGLLATMSDSVASEIGAYQ